MATQVIDQTPRNVYSAAAAQTIFPYTFLILVKTDITVEQNGNTLVVDDDYAVSDVTVLAGGNITLTSGASNNDAITIFRSQNFDREVDYQESGDFLAGTVNGDFNRMILMLQQNREEHERELQYDINDTISGRTIPALAARLGKVLGFDSAGDLNVQSFTDTGSASDATIAAAVDNHLNQTRYELGSTAAISSHDGISAGHIINTSYFDTNRTAGSASDAAFTNTTTVGKAGNWNDDDGAFYDADGKQFAIINRPRSVLQYGAGVGDSTTSIQAAINSIAATDGGKLLVPAKVYTLTAPLDVEFNGLDIVGDGANSIFSRSTDYGSTLRVFDSDGTEQIVGFWMRSIKFQSSGLTTSGAHIFLDALTVFNISEIYIRQGFIGFDLLGCTGGQISNVYMVFQEIFGGSAVGRKYLHLRSSANTAVAGSPQGGDVFFNNFNGRGAGGAATTVTQRGIEVNTADGYWFVNCHIGNTTQYNLLLDANAAESLGSCQFTQVWFDKCSGDNIRITGTTPAVIGRYYFTTCTIKGGGTAEFGVRLINSEADNIRFSDCTITEHNNHGIDIQASWTGKDASFWDNQILDNSFTTLNNASGINIADNVDNVHINGGEVRGTKHLRGIAIAGSNHDNVQINNVNVLDNPNAGMSKLEGTNIQQKNNIGFNPLGVDTAITVTASPFTYTNATGYNQEVRVGGGTVSVIAKNATNLSGLTFGMFTLGPSETLTVTYSGAPTMSAFGL